MAASNFPTGFVGFQIEINTLVDALGGHLAVRCVVAKAHDKALHDVIATRVYGNSYSYPFEWGRQNWIEATNDDFAASIDTARKYFRSRATDPVPDQIWVSEVLNAEIKLRGSDLFLERGEHAVFLACGREDEHARSRIHPAQTIRRDPWHVALMDSGEMILSILKRRPDKAATTAQGLAGAQKTLKRFAALFV